jgi:predicted amidohydrolase YtcJ
MNPALPRADWLVADGGMITGVGLGKAPSAAESYDLDGGCLLPGFQDAHVHPPKAGVVMNQCDLHDAEPADYLDIIRNYVRDNPDEPWVLGGGWAMHDYPGGIALAGVLDTVVADRPALLHGSEGHGAWVNTRALELARIDAATPDPVDGRIERLPDGSPSGTLQEGAVDLVERLAPPVTIEQLRAGIMSAQRYLTGLGITAWQDAWVTEPDQRAYLEADAAGELQATAIGALWWDRERGLEQIDELIARSRRDSPRFRPRAVKLMVDGVCENGTAAMLQPYAGSRDRGITFIDREILIEAVPRLMAAGLQPHFHAIGDRAIRDSLDAVEAGEPRHIAATRPHISHIQVIDPDDVPRFGAIGVAANAQAFWACNDGCMVELTVPRLGARANQQYPFRSLIDTGSRLVCGSDWAVSTADPFAQMAVATTRREEPNAAPFVPAQAISRVEALQGFTTGSAWINHREQESGTLESGKRADLVVASEDPLRAADLGAVFAVATFIDGAPVGR